MDNLSRDNDIIENEIGNEVVGIDVPFDPNQINVSSPPMNVGDIIDRLENGEIMLDTEFQRLPDLWDNVKKSRFIESLLLKLPIPKFYFDGQDDNKWRVIDGLQRISTFKSFIKEKTMRLQGLEFLKELRADKDLHSMSVFVMTTSNDDKDRFDAYNYNVAGYIVKPISFESFVAAISILNNFWQLCEQP